MTKYQQKMKKLFDDHFKNIPTLKRKKKYVKKL